MQQDQALHVVQNIMDRAVQSGVLKTLQEAAIVAQAMQTISQGLMKPQAAPVTSDMPPAS